LWCGHLACFLTDKQDAGKMPAPQELPRLLLRGPYRTIPLCFIAATMLVAICARPNWEQS
jgi:hypothetical protein